MFMSEFNVGNIKIGGNAPPYFIAEIGSNFDGSLSRAKDLIYLAKEAGAHAAKFQHYTAETLVSDFGFKALGQQFGHQRNWSHSVFDTYKRAALERDWTSELFDTCCKAGIHFMTSPYSLDLVEYVDQYVPAYKVGSGDITWINILDAISKKNKPVFLATGASSISDVTRAVQIIKNNNNQIVLMQCNTNYLVNKSNLRYQNIRVLETYKSLFPQIILGLSDHTQGISAVMAAYTLGARVFEKHFTDDISRDGPDHGFAIDVNGFKEMIDKVSELEVVLGSSTKIIEQNEVETAVVQRRSLHAARDIKRGESFKIDDFLYLRPCPEGAVLPYQDLSVVGKKSKIDLLRGQTIKLIDIE
jgi:N-acetylneuraminate synthase